MYFINSPMTGFPSGRMLPLLFILLMTSACAATSESVHELSPVQGTVLQEARDDKSDSLEKISYEELLSRGNRHLSQRNSKLALLHFQMALKRRGDSAEAYAGLGETLALTGDNQASHSFLDQALRLDQQNRPALLSTGKLYREEENYSQAEISFTRALKIYPANPEILTELAITYGRMGQEDQAEPLLLQVVRLKPGDASARNNLGFNYLLRGDYPAAIETFREALKIAPDSPRVLNNLAAAYALNSQPNKALNLFRKTGNEATAYNDLGYFYLMLGKDEPARAAFKKALWLHPRHYVRARENLSLLETEP
ncbi:MAG: tetratricopeptide repeat protein [Desulfobulbales bacterium]|nr:tetratricopeptide repeat protein [Desulfobulbales bacterium]